jgi:hypothetical protein
MSREGAARLGGAQPLKPGNAKFGPTLSGGPGWRLGAECLTLPIELLPQVIRPICAFAH